jgi:MFS family permease
MAGHAFVPRKIALTGVWLFSTGLFAFAFNRNFSLAILFLVVSGFGMMLFFSTSNTVLQTIVPDDMRGRVMGVWSVVFGAMIPLGSLEAGALATWIGAPEAIALGAMVCAVAAVITLLVVRRRDAMLSASSAE